MSLSACLIVKNESKHLEKCLSCLKDNVDEIIVVDTGSSDSTKEIAAKFTSKIFDFAWKDDFSEARKISELLDHDESETALAVRALVGKEVALIGETMVFRNILHGIINPSFILN